MAKQAPLSQHSMNWCLLSKPHFLLTLLSVTNTLKTHILAAGLILIILAFPHSFHLLVSLLFFLVLQKSLISTSSSSPSPLHLLSIPSHSSSSNLTLSLSLSSLGATPLLISCTFHEPMSHVLSTALAFLISILFPFMCVPFFLSITQFFPRKALYSFLPSSICVNTTPSLRFPCKHAQSPATPLQSL